MSSQSPINDVPILVTGGTGTLGSLVVDRLLAAGQPVRVLSRGHKSGNPATEHVTADLNTGAGVTAALKDVATIIHLAGTQKGDDAKTRTLVAAANQAGVRHLVYISVVGADRIPVKSAVDRMMFAYFASKRGAEKVVEESGVPWTTLRATQFDQSFLMLIRAMAKSPVIPAPGWSFQPIDAEVVADRLVELSRGEPRGYVEEMGGPSVYRLADMIGIYLRWTNKHRLILGAPTPGGAARAVKAGANLTPGHVFGPTWEQFLEDHLSVDSLKGHATANL